MALPDEPHEQALKDQTVANDPATYGLDHELQLRCSSLHFLIHIMHRLLRIHC
jgi:hypothetical protein